MTVVFCSSGDPSCVSIVFLSFFRPLRSLLPPFFSHSFFLLLRGFPFVIFTVCGSVIGEVVGQVSSEAGRAFSGIQTRRFRPLRETFSESGGNSRILRDYRFVVFYLHIFPTYLNVVFLSRDLCVVIVSYCTVSDISITLLVITNKIFNPTMLYGNWLSPFYFNRFSAPLKRLQRWIERSNYVIYLADHKINTKNIVSAICCCHRYVFRERRLITAFATADPRSFLSVFSSRIFVRDMFLAILTFSIVSS